MTDLIEILRQFGIKVNGKDDVRPYSDGHINDTYLVNSDKKYILQKINTNIFKNPEKLMDNICLVTEFLADKIKKAGGDPLEGTLTVVKTPDGKTFVNADGNAYRLYLFINGISYNLSTNEILYEAGRAFGKFQNDLSEFDATLLYESIVDFHNTRKRFANLQKAVKENRSGRADKVKAEIEFAFSCEKYVDAILDGIKDKSVPLRVTHNDTKLNNILFNEKTKKCMSVIDLDTVMPGSMLYDFGDAMRFGASSAAEDETNLDLVYCDLGKFKAFTQGFLGEIKESATKREIELLPLSVLLMTYECGIRFLSDYIDGDVYFKVHYPEHNIDRARNQFKLVRDIESKLGEMDKIVSDIIK